MALLTMLAVALGDPQDVLKKIEIAEKGKVAGTSVYLKDIAQYSGFTEAEKTILESIDLNIQVAVGDTVKLKRLDVVKKIRQQIQLIEQNSNQHVTLSIPENVSIEVVSPNSIEAIRKNLLDRLAAQNPDVEIQLRGFQVSRAKDLPEDVTWELFLDQKISKGPSNFRIDFFKEGVKIHQGWVSADVRIFAQVPTANRSLQIGKRVEEDDFKVEKIDITMKTDISLASRLIGSKVKRGIREGALILNSDVEAEKVVNKGDVVDLLVSEDNWRISIRGQTMDAGYVGDLVRVLNITSKKILNGTVVSKGVVKLQ